MKGAKVTLKTCYRFWLFQFAGWAKKVFFPWKITNDFDNFTLRMFFSFLTCSICLSLMTSWMARILRAKYSRLARSRHRHTRAKVPGEKFSTMRQGIRLWKSVHQHWSNKPWAPGWRFTWHKSGGQNPCNRVTWCSLFYHFALIVCFFVWLHAAGTTFPIPMVFPARRILEVGVFRFCASRLRQKAHQDAQEA